MKDAGGNGNRLRRASLRVLSVVVIVAYVSLTAGFLFRHLIGDTPPGPFGYFWTWDMFPNYPTESSRRLAIGVTETGAPVRLFPNPQHRFRWGVQGDATRLDLDRRHLFFRRAVLDAVRRYQPSHPNDPVVRVYLVENYWPVKFNLPDEWYGELNLADSGSGGKRTPDRSYWRILETAAVSADGRIEEWGASQ